MHRVRKADHPRVSLELQHVKKDWSVPIRGIADSSAQSNLWSFKQFREAGFTESDLEPVSKKVQAADKSPIKIIGSFNAVFRGRSPKGAVISSTSTVYVSDAVSDFFLSYDSMVDLSILSSTFPTVGENHKTCAANTMNPTTAKPGPAESGKSSGKGEPCQCPRRTSVPSKPLTLPFPPIEENNTKMKAWLLETFASSTFNTCPHQPLQQMDGPPMEFHVDPQAKPHVRHNPSPIPIHWQERVKEDIYRDVALDVIEPVPYGTPVTWCHPMVVTRKHDGSPRRTVDLSPLNKHCKRETYANESPFTLARRIPRETWKTVTDAWNGYHSVPLRVEDRHLTTFITPFGRFRYKRAPQGFVSSGDGYNRRFNAIISDFERKERCVDDTIHFDTNLKDHWWRTIEFLIKVGSAGIVLNPTKFQFACKEVEFAGFKISADSIEPLPKYLDAIRTFPTPKTATDVKSWFGLINQVSNYAQLRDLMAPFRSFLSPKVKFEWSEDLDNAFERSKRLIVEAIRHGVQIFDLNKPTCLRPDWSSKGIGYFLTQKHCNCPEQLPDCCQDGWVVTLAGSRFLSGAEKRYAPVEGEALAIAWGLEQCKYFTQGCSNLLVVTDHKPLVKIFGDRTLDEISNSRLFRLKQRTLPWSFVTAYMPGKTNLAADATSRHPSPNCQQVSTTEDDEIEELMNAAITQELQDTIAITWEQVAAATKADPVMSILLEHLEIGCEQDFKPCLSQFVRYQEALYVCDGVVMFRDRVVVPEKLRPSVLKNLHAAHQGVSSMEQRAHSIVFWPGMTHDIHKVRSECYHCNRNAPSNSHVPSVTPDPPSTPFEKIFSDFFSLGGNHYLVIGDRLSGWTEIFSTPTGTSKSGAHGLIMCLRKLFSTFGVPQELSSDGGPEFASETTSKFLKDWDIAHRISSAYHPISNGRAEVAVKAAKRLLRSNVSPSGSLNSDNFLRAMLQFRNTPDPDCSLSPAEIIFGRPLRDSFSFANRLEKFSNTKIRKTWRDAWAAKEEALRTRFAKTTERLNVHSRHLRPLKVGDRCLVQNQTGNYPRRWDRSGIVTEALPFDQYTVKIDGSSRVTKRNRQFLKPYTPVDTAIANVVPREASTHHTWAPRKFDSPVPLVPPPPASPLVSERDVDQPGDQPEATEVRAEKPKKRRCV